MFTKTFKEYDFDYNVEYIKQNHLEQDASGVKRDDNGILPYFNYDKVTHLIQRTNVLHFQSSTSKVHNDYEQPDSTEEILQKRISQHIIAQTI